MPGPPRIHRLAIQQFSNNPAARGSGGQLAAPEGTPRTLSPPWARTGLAGDFGRHLRETPEPFPPSPRVGVPTREHTEMYGKHRAINSIYLFFYGPKITFLRLSAFIDVLETLIHRGLLTERFLFPLSQSKVFPTSRSIPVGTRRGATSCSEGFSERQETNPGVPRSAQIPPRNTESHRDAPQSASE